MIEESRHDLWNILRQMSSLDVNNPHIFCYIMKAAVIFISPCPENLIRLVLHAWRTHYSAKSLHFNSFPITDSCHHRKMRQPGDLGTYRTCEQQL